MTHRFDTHRLGCAPGCPPAPAERRVPISEAQRGVVEREGLWDAPLLGDEGEERLRYALDVPGFLTIPADPNEQQALWRELTCRGNGYDALAEEIGQTGASRYPGERRDARNDARAWYALAAKVGP